VTSKILYHANCFDGIGAAWAAWNCLTIAHGFQPDPEPIYYGDPLPALESGDELILVDYSRPADELLALHAKGVKVCVIDHHKTFLQQMEKIKATLGPSKPGRDGLYHVDGFEIFFSLEKSGALLAWEYFGPCLVTPKLLEHISDRDLWKFQMEGTREVHAALCTYPKEIDTYNKLVQRPIEELIGEGRQILRYHELLVDQFCSQVFTAQIGDYQVPCVNVSMLFSEVPHKLLQLYPDAPFTAYIYQRKDCHQYGLRGRGDIDVSEIAKQYGGGGHRDAAGFERKGVLV
jgi:hypothetical protein